MSSRSFRLQVVAAVALSLGGIVAACDSTFPSPLNVYDPDAASQDTGAPVSGEAGADGGPDAATADASDSGHATDGGDGGHATDGGDGGETADGSGLNGSTDARFDAE